MASSKNQQMIDSLWGELRNLNQANPNQQAQLPDRINAAGLTIDLTRQTLDSKCLDTLIKLAQAHEITDQINDLINGQPINNTENRPAHHTALRDWKNTQWDPAIAQTLNKVCTIADALQNQTWRGADDQTITDIVNIGIGGSDLGPRMVCHALSANQADTLNVHFVANVDPREMDITLNALSPKNTLFIVASKSFGTIETLENAKAARQWLLKEMTEADLNKHLIAVSSNVARAVDFGVGADNVLPMWDWVGGRYSLWSAIGLPIAIAVGAENFKQLLAGAYAMDQHFQQAPLDENAPCLLALIELWHVNIKDAQSVAVLPYSHELGLFPSYLQQLTMESNGKQVSKTGEPLEIRTCPTVWGSAGTIGQHSFHQLLHQGTENIPVDFILPLKSHSDDLNRHTHLVANCLAQSKALTEGKTLDQAQNELIEQGMDETSAATLAPHKVIPGNRPNTIIAMDTLDAHNLGALIALYEHKVYVQSVLWQTNAFDQWGVELGKQLSDPIYSAMSGEDSETDQTTQYWIDQFKQAQ